MECEDGSDEEDCGMVVMRAGYNKLLTPVSADGARSLLVNVSLDIIDILEINELDEIFTVKISLRRDWFDSGLTFKHLKSGGSKSNILSKVESDAIWHPSVDIDNIEEWDRVKKTSIADVHRVIPNENFAFTYKDNVHLFKGSENQLTLTKQWTVGFICHYSMHWYPFDTQVCSMEFLRATEFTELQPVLLQHNRDISLDRYFIRGIRICKSTAGGGKDAIVAEVTLGRPIVSNVLTVFIPTTTLVSISFIARAFAEDYIDMVIQVNLTIQLVLATL